MVLISIDEALRLTTPGFLKGAFAIGKAAGDIVPKRAIIQMVKLQHVDGKGF